MNIDTNSWHYRLIKFFNRRRPYDLCSYVRLLVVSMILAITMVCVGCIVIAGAVLMLIWSPGMWLYSLFDPTLIPTHDQNIAAALGAFLWAFMVCVTTYMYLQERKGWFKPSNKPKKKWMIVEYIKDKHNKVCTAVNYK